MDLESGLSGVGKEHERSYLCEVITGSAIHATLVIRFCSPLCTYDVHSPKENTFVPFNLVYLNSGLHNGIRGFSILPVSSPNGTIKVVASI